MNYDEAFEKFGKMAAELSAEHNLQAVAIVTVDSVGKKIAMFWGSQFPSTPELMKRVFIRCSEKMLGEVENFNKGDMSAVKVIKESGFGEHHRN